VASASWHWEISWGCPWGSKSSGIEFSVSHKAAEALGSTCAGVLVSRRHSSWCTHGITKSEGSKSSRAYLLSTGFQESSTGVVEAHRNEAWGQWSSWICLPEVGFQKHSTIILQAWGTKPMDSGNPGAFLLHAVFQKHNILLLQAWGKQACCLEPSITHGSMEDLGSVYSRVHVSLVFQDEE
jgi:hypothetical protein